MTQGFAALHATFGSPAVLHQQSGRTFSVVITTPGPRSTSGREQADFTEADDIEVVLTFDRTAYLAAGVTIAEGDTFSGGGVFYRVQRFDSSPSRAHAKAFCRYDRPDGIL